MKTLGIIGGIGSGKSTAAEFFRQLDAAIIKVDDIGHQVLRLSKIKESAQQRWGDSVFSTDGEIDRRKLAAVVFADENELAFLKNLTHPLIAEEVLQQRKKIEHSSVQLCLLDAPLLIESGWEYLVDVIIFVSAPVEVRWERIKSRGWSETEWKQRESAQLPVEKKSRRADVVLDNSGDVEHLRSQVETLVRKFVYTPARQ